MITGYKVTTAVVIRLSLQGSFSLPGLDVSNGDVTIEGDLGPNGELPAHIQNTLALIAEGPIATAVEGAVQTRPLPQQ